MNQTAQAVISDCGGDCDAYWNGSRLLYNWASRQNKQTGSVDTRGMCVRARCYVNFETQNMQARSAQYSTCMHSGARRSRESAKQTAEERREACSCPTGGGGGRVGERRSRTTTCAGNWKRRKETGMKGWIALPQDGGQSALRNDESTECSFEALKPTPETGRSDSTTTSMRWG